MRIAVVIPARDEEERIAAAVRSAREAGAEVIVVDGGSRDATVQRAEHAGARVLACAPGRARQLAFGAESARAADALVFLHADTTLPAGWAARVEAVLADPRVAGGAFAFRFAERGALLRLVELGVKLRLALARLPYGDQALFVRASVLRALGGVPQAPIMEDLDLVRGIRAHGRLALLPEAVTTSARRYRARGVLRTFARNAVALAAWSLGLDRARVAAWYRS
ncbi:MAG TPA: TIGR04283 family arsenosugar biosynthesis glycosyltransferase [Myxococcota bacterium]